MYTYNKCLCIYICMCIYIYTYVYIYVYVCATYSRNPTWNYSRTHAHNRGSIRTTSIPTWSKTRTSNNHHNATLIQPLTGDDISSRLCCIKTTVCNNNSHKHHKFASLAQKQTTVFVSTVRQQPLEPLLHRKVPE